MPIAGAAPTTRSRSPSFNSADGAAAPRVCGPGALVDGIMFPFRAIETEIVSGRELSSMQWGAIEVDRELPSQWFSPPAFERTPLQESLEHLYHERADTSALQWTYAAFRLARPDIDTRAGIEAIGYQILKMGDHAGAIALLTMNARDYPLSSSAAFGVGRAFVAAGDVAQARRAFERALQLDPNNKRASDALASLSRSQDAGAGKGADSGRLAQSGDRLERNWLSRRRPATRRTISG